MKAIFCLFLLTTALFAKPEPFDRISAVVDGEIILHSEVMSALYQMNNMPGFAGLPAAELEKKVLDQLVDNKVLLARAKLDTVIVTESELNDWVENHLNSLQASQKMDREALAKAVEAQMGVSLEDFKTKLKQQHKEQSILQKIRGKYVGVVSPTPKEVQSFYKGYKDSLPKEYNAVKLSHIQLKIKPSKASLDSTRATAKEILHKLDLGESFESLVKEYSEDESSKYNEGDLGYFKKGALAPEYERAAFRLEQGLYTGYPVKTDKGFHIIKLLSRKDSEIRTAHILLRSEPVTADTARIQKLADSLKVATQPFDKLASIFSEDKKSNTKGGNLGWFTQTSLHPRYAEAIKELAVGAVSEPVLIDNSWHIFKVVGREKERSLTPEDDWSQLENFTRSNLSNEKMKSFIQVWRQDTYIEYRD